MKCDESANGLDAAAMLVRLLEERGGAAYFGEPVTVLEHSLQAAHSAAAAGAKAAAVAAALLHDVGHMLHGLDEGIAARGLDGKHEELAAEYLSRWFGPEVTAPIRLHVPAKRFLCWQNPEYLGELSPASLESLALQGGPMSEREARAFLDDPFARAAVELRRWDDEAKVPGLAVPPAVHYLPILRAVCRREIG
jgi:phosphonate degradation associated HDIG domain protein